MMKVRISLMRGNSDVEPMIGGGLNVQFKYIKLQRMERKDKKELEKRPFSSLGVDGWLGIKTSEGGPKAISGICRRLLGSGI
jgi:hypothetical protein